MEHLLIIQVGLPQLNTGVVENRDEGDVLVPYLLGGIEEQLVGPGHEAVESVGHKRRWCLAPDPLGANVSVEVIARVHGVVSDAVQVRNCLQHQ